MLFRKNHLNEVLETTSASMDVFVPAIVDGTSRFALYGEQGEVTEPNFQLQNTKIPPKGLLFPSTEKLYTWGKGPDGAFINSALETPRPFVAFGVRPCDAAAIERMDQVFLSKGYIDEFYQAKRNALTLVAMACPRTSDACFCDSMGQSPNAAPEADILLLEDNDAFEVHVQTERGQALADAWKPFLEEGEVDRQPIECVTKVSMEGVAEKLHGMFDSPLWDEVSTASPVAAAHSYAQLATASISVKHEKRKKTPASVAGIAACSRTTHSWQAITTPASKSEIVYDSASCTSCASSKNDTENRSAWAAGVAWSTAPHPWTSPRLSTA